MATRKNLIVSDLPPSALLEDLAKRGVTRALLECGPRLAAAFLADDLVDELVHFVAPHELVMPGESDISSMQLNFSRFATLGTYMAGDDCYTHYQRIGDRF